MTIKEITDLLEAEVLCGEEILQKEVNKAFASDMMSDVLAYADPISVLLTGLCNPQVIRTAEMLDISCIVFVRGKNPDEAMLQLADEMDIAVLATPLYMFNACGYLYKEGMLGGGKVR